MLRRQRKQKSTSQPDLIIVGLGNPGEKYAETRHNVGQEVLKALSLHFGGSFKKSKTLSQCSEIQIQQKKVVLAIPQTFMNESGMSLQKLVHRYNVTNPENILIVHDELDLEPGTMKIKLGGGLAGHNGLKSIEQHLKTKGFGRLRIGIGKPGSSELGKNYVLKRPSKNEQEEIETCIGRSIEVIQSLLSSGYEQTMNKFNGNI